MMGILVYPLLTFFIIVNNILLKKVIAFFKSVITLYDFIGSVSNDFPGMKIQCSFTTNIYLCSIIDLTAANYFICYHSEIINNLARYV